MSSRKWIVSAVLVAGLCALACAAWAADEKKMDDKKMMDASGMDPAMMQQMMEMAAPGEQHKGFDKYLGDWKASIKMWMGPGDPTISTGKVHFETTLGGRYLMGIHTAIMGGMPFEGHSLDGYDNYKKEYFSLWIDNMGTGYMAMTGTCSADGKTATYKGSSFDPMVGKDVEMKEVLNWTSATAYTFSMYSMASGKETKMMEISYTR